MEQKKIDLWWTEFKELMPLYVAGRVALKNNFGGDEEKMKKALALYDQLLERF